MSETYQVDVELFELFEIAARYSGEPSVDTLTNKLIASLSKPPITNTNTNEYTRAKIENLLHAQRNKYQEQKQKEEDNKKNAKNGLTAGGIVIGAMGAISFLVIGNVISTAALTGVGIVTISGAIMAIVGSVIKLQIDVSMPNGLKVRFESLNDRYGRPFSS